MDALQPWISGTVHNKREINTPAVGSKGNTGVRAKDHGRCRALRHGVRCPRSLHGILPAGTAAGRQNSYKLGQSIGPELLRGSNVAVGEIVAVIVEADDRLMVASGVAESLGIGSNRTRWIERLHLPGAGTLEGVREVIAVD